MFDFRLPPHPDAACVDTRLALLGRSLVKRGSERPSLSGRLYRSRSGWALLHVPNALGIGAFKSLKEPGLELPISESFNRYNAHISVMSGDEVDAIEAKGVKIKEFGHSFDYRIGGLKVVRPKTWDGVSKCWVLEVESPDLKALRRSYGLTGVPHDGEHPFHITVGIRRTHVLGENGTSKAAMSPQEVAFWEHLARETWKADEPTRADFTKAAATYLTERCGRPFAGPDIDAATMKDAEAVARSLGLTLVGELLGRFDLR